MPGYADDFSASRQTTCRRRVIGFQRSCPVHGALEACAPCAARARERALRALETPSADARQRPRPHPPPPLRPPRRALRALETPSAAPKTYKTTFSYTTVRPLGFLPPTRLSYRPTCKKRPQSTRSPSASTQSTRRLRVIRWGLCLRLEHAFRQIQYVCSKTCTKTERLPV